MIYKLVSVVTVAVPRIRKTIAGYVAICREWGYGVVVSRRVVLGEFMRKYIRMFFFLVSARAIYSVVFMFDRGVVFGFVVGRDFTVWVR